MTPEQRQFLVQATASARMVGHVYPEMAACEAGLESNYGQSYLALKARNLFGLKQREHPVYGSINLPTREFLGGGWTVVQADFVSYPTIEDCFADRLATLTRLSSVYPHYKAALLAPDAETFVREVSQTWSTDPNRAEHVIAIWKEFLAGAEQEA